MKKVKTLCVMGLIGICTVLLTACATGVVKDRDLYRKTAFALLSAPDTFVISEQRRSGTRVDYVVKTNAGTFYNCFVTGGLSLSGKTVSDATCQKQ